LSQAIGKVTGDLAAARGPDVELRVNVDRSWFGAEVQVILPRNLNCAACSGGGCDRCARAGALSIEERGAAPREVRLVLPPLGDPNCDVCLRVPGEGALPLGEGSELGRGHLMLILHPDESSDAQLRLLTEAPPTDQLRIQLMKRSLIMAASLILLFIGLLRLSGWL
jgi:hypothetical protein